MTTHEAQGVMKCDPATAPAPEKWLALEEVQRLDPISPYHRRMRVKLRS